MTTVPQQQQSSGYSFNTMPLIIFGALSLVFGFVTWLVLPSLGVLPDAVSAEAERTDALFRVLMGIGGVVFFLVQGLIYYAAIAFRAKDGDTSDGPNIHGNLVLEIVWTIVPSVIVVFLAIYSYTVWVNNTAVPENPNAMATIDSDSENVLINAIGQRYAWSFEYITNDFADEINDDDTISEGTGERVVLRTTDLYIYAGQSVDINMNTIDVIHSFWAPEMRVKQDLLPGRTTNIRFTPQSQNVDEWEYVMLLNPVTVYTEANFDSEILVEFAAPEEGELPQPIELALADPTASITTTEGTIWVPVLNERGVEGFVPVNPETEIGRYNRYRLICTELCGGGHGDMFTDIVMFENREQFEMVWYTPNVELLSAPVGNPVELGIGVIGVYGCSGCHVLDELGWAGNQGPSLEGIGARSTVRAEASGDAIGNVNEIGAEYIVQSIRLSQDYLVPGYPAIMPVFHPGSNIPSEMPAEELAGIVAYLCTQTGTGNPADSDCGLTNWEFDDAGEFIGDSGALFDELLTIIEEYQ